MKAWIKGVCALTLCACLPAAQAASGDVLLLTPITYDPHAGVVQKVRDQCELEHRLERRLGPVLAKRNASRRGSIADGTDPHGAALLRLTITHVLGIGGGAWTGPKAITLRAELLDGSRVLRQQKVNRWSMGGFWGGFKGTCSILDRVTVRLAKDLSRWAYDMNYRMEEDEEPPKEDTAAADSPASAPDDDNP